MSVCKLKNVECGMQGDADKEGQSLDIICCKSEETLKNMKRRRSLAERLWDFLSARKIKGLRIGVKAL